jgi:hypothetical protein
MHLITLTAVSVVLALAACGATPGDSSTLLIDRATPPFPYNSRICP